MNKILFVCTGNTCRSPLAEALLKQKRPDLQVQSAGVSAVPGMEASEGTTTVLKEKDITINHITKLVDKALMEWAELVLTLTEQHKALLLKQFPRFDKKIFTLKEYAYKDQYASDFLNLHKLYAEIELKQARFLSENKEQIDELNRRGDVEAKQTLLRLTENFHHQIKEEKHQLEILEQTIPSFDVADPFGGSTQLYRETLKEIETAINLIIEKL